MQRQVKVKNSSVIHKKGTRKLGSTTNDYDFLKVWLID